LVEGLDRLFSAIKLMVLPLLAIILYYHDLDNITLASFGVLSGKGLGFMIAAISLTVSGVLLKKGIISQYSTVSKVSYLWGTIALILSLGLYVWGSYQQVLVNLYHYESLLLFVSAYIILRFNSRTIRTLFPLFLLLGLLPLTLLISAPVNRWQYLEPFLAASILVISYSFLLRFSSGSVMVSLFMATLSVICWFFPSLYLLGFANLGIAMIQADVRFNKIFGLKKSAAHNKCLSHTRINYRGFCYSCGEQVQKSGYSTWNISGLVIIVIIVLVLTQIHIPLLTLENNHALLSTATYYGWQNTTLPATPQGWLKYSSETDVVPGDTYSVQTMVVPSYHPETKNYTLIYEASPSILNFMSSITASPGYNWSVTSYQLDGEQGRLILGIGREVNLMYYTVSSTYLFINTSDFISLNTGLTIERQFPPGNISSETSVFLADASSLLSSTNYQSLAGSWTPWAESMLYNFKSSIELILVLASIGTISSVTYAILFVNRRHLKAIQEASMLSGEDWALLSMISMLNKSRAVGAEIAKTVGSIGNQFEFLDKIASSLASLEKKGLLKGVIYESGDTLRMTWKVSG
jgi:hypothetical protein